MVYVLLGKGFEETEAIAPIDLMRRAGIPVLTVGIGSKTVFGGHGIGVEADITLGEMDLTDLEMIVLPGGLGGVASIRGSKEAMAAVAFAAENGRYVAAICAGPTVLADLGITDGRKVTCYPGCEKDMGSAEYIPNAACVQDGNVITGRSAGTAFDFALELIAALCGGEKAKEIAHQIVFN